MPLAFVERNKQPAIVGLVRICSWASCVNVSSWSLPLVLGKAASRAESARSRVYDLSLLMSSSYRQLEWEHKRLQTRLERLRSENLDLRKRLAGIRDMCVSDRPLPRAGSADSLRRELSAESLSPRARADSNPK